MVRAEMLEERPCVPFSNRAARQEFDSCLEHGAVVVSTMLDVPVATMGLLQERAPFSDAQWLRVLWCFVRPAHRRVPHMREMLRAARSMARAADLAVLIECSGGEAVHGKLALFRRELGEGAGVTYLVRG